MNNEEEIRSRFFDLTTKAAVAENSGEDLSAVNLYLAAYELVKNGSDDALKNALVGVKKAWDIVIRINNRPLAEHIYDILCRHIKEPELNVYSDQLHELMIGKLKNLGLPIDSITESSNVGEALDKMKNLVTGGSNNEQTKPPVQKPAPANIESTNKDKNADKDALFFKRELSKYDNLVGYESAIAYMRNNGLIDTKNSEHMQLVERLNKEHGLNRISFTKTMIFKSPSRVDANLFMEATAAEIGLPCMQMHMDDNIAGSSVLCMMAPANGNFRLNPSRTGFDGKGILMLEDVDAWDLPDPNDLPQEEGIAGFLNMQMSRGVAEISNLIAVALDDPNILVMATVGDNVDKDEIFKFLGADDFSVIRIDNPNANERAAIWQRLAHDHPSLRAFSIQKLVNYSNNMSRYDIEIAVHEALEDAYRQGIKKGEYIPLSIVNIVEKLADHQPLGSSEYKALEDLATADFKKDLENIDDILK